jgi:HSP20 family molecular chaperone IbpA
MSTTQTDVVRREPDEAHTPALIPLVDVSEDETGITLLADLPGADRESLSIRVDGDTLTLEAPIALGEPKEMEAVYAEVRAGRWRRSFTLSRELDSASIEATLKDGLLTLRLPKQERARPRRIEVRAD